MVLPIIWAALGGVVSAIGARSAARSQSSAARQAAEIQAKAAEKTNRQLGQWRAEDMGRFNPYARSGGAAQNALAYEMGLGPMPTGYAGFQASPGYQFAMDQGREAVQGSVAARQGLNSGAVLAELTRFGQGLANQEYGNFYNRLAGLADTGLRAVAAQGDIGQRYGNAIAGNIINAGQSSAQGVANAGSANAAGTVGATNAFNNALTQGVGMWQQNRMLNAFMPQTSGAPMFGGGR